MHIIVLCIFSTHTFLSIYWDLQSIPRLFQTRETNLTIWLLEFLALTTARFFLFLRPTVSQVRYIRVSEGVGHRGGKDRERCTLSLTWGEG